MSTYQQDLFLSEILEGEKIPLGKLAYFRERLRNQLYELVITEFLDQEKTKNLTRAELARRIGRRPEQITRWLGAPGNWTIDTVSDLMLAMGTEPELSIADLSDQQPDNNHATHQVERGQERLRSNMEKWLQKHLKPTSQHSLSQFSFTVPSQLFPQLHPSFPQLHPSLMAVEQGQSLH